MNPMNIGKKLSIMDQFFLGGPLTLRGFNIKGVGPHEDGLSMLLSQADMMLNRCHTALDCGIEQKVTVAERINRRSMSGAF